MTAEVFAGISAIKSAFDLAKSLQNMHDATARDRAIMELQKEILSAQAAQFTLIEQVSALKADIAKFEEWAAEKQRYELKELGHPGTFAYFLKEVAQASEPTHAICPDCYQHGKKSILQQITRNPGRTDVRLCHQCGWETYVSGGWYPEHGKRRS